MNKSILRQCAAIGAGVNFVILLLFFPLASRAQQFDIDDLNDEVEDATESVGSIVENIIIVALIIGLVGVVWQLVNDQEQGKRYLIGWGVAAVVYVVIFRFLNLV